MRPGSCGHPPGRRGGTEHERAAAELYPRQCPAEAEERQQHRDERLDGGEDARGRRPYGRDNSPIAPTVEIAAGAASQPRAGEAGGLAGDDDVARRKVGRRQAIPALAASGLAVALVPGLAIPAEHPGVLLHPTGVTRRILAIVRAADAARPSVQAMLAALRR
jgi:DNA-binding transcriptional LysR family regulator